MVKFVVVTYTICADVILLVQVDTAVTEVTLHDIFGPFGYIVDASIKDSSINRVCILTLVIICLTS
jgi:hypothetical protein